jgi:magnesium chelatase accessory protein
MTARLDWAVDGRDWPNRAASRFVEAGGLRWHVQILGHGPPALLLHGTGAATHSWRGLAPLLSAHYNVIAPDLPGHGFTETPSQHGLSLPGMARCIAQLLATLGVSPALAVGHSAGAAILARMCIDGAIAPDLLVSLNGAFVPMASPVFAPAARLIAGLPLLPRLLSAYGRETSAVTRLIGGTGSTLDAVAIEFYRRLFGNPAHVAGVLGMMANWDLPALYHDLPRLRTKLLLITGAADRTIPPSDAALVRRLVPQAARASLAGLGHLAHEERPDLVAALIPAPAQATPRRPVCA